MTTNTNTTLTLRGALSFAKQIERLPEELREALRLMFHNPTDAAAVAFDAFAAAEQDETLAELLDTACELRLRNAEQLLAARVAWANAAPAAQGGAR